MKNLLLGMACLLALPSFAQLRLPSFIDNGMVLQQKKVNRIWGWQTPGQLVKVQVKGRQYLSYADAAGSWQVFVEPMQAGAVGDIAITSGAEKIMLQNVLAGEVWICSGQSNMEWKMGSLKNTYPEELKTAANDNIRFVTIQKSFHNQPQSNVELETKWAAVSPATVGNCSAVAYWFAKQLQQKLQVPVGLVVTSWGGTPAQSWTSFEGLAPFEGYTSVFARDIQPLQFAGMENQQKQWQKEYEEALVQQQPAISRYMYYDAEDTEWPVMTLPGAWENQGYPALDGVVAYRLSFDLPAAAEGQPATLHMPAIDDMDSTYINGRFVGSINMWNELRKYKIPAGVLNAGRNTLAIRVQDDGGGGGLAGDSQQFFVEVAGKKVPLAGKARFKIVAERKGFAWGAIQNQPAVLYNAMIAPLLPLSIGGAIWYQGESNTGMAYEYRSLFPGMIQDWRNRWGQGDFPFLFVQLSSYGKLTKDPVESSWAELREAQTMTLKLPNTGMAVTTDVGNPEDIHPVRKKEVGDRLALNALNKVYGQKSVEYSGPQLDNWKVQGNQIVLNFSHANGGLIVKGKAPMHFAIAGADKKFVWANAVVKGNAIIVSHPSISKPAAVRYAWAESPVDANVFNKEGLPAVPFRTDSWKGVTQYQ